MKSLGAFPEHRRDMEEFNTMYLRFDFLTDEDRDLCMRVLRKHIPRVEWGGADLLENISPSWQCDLHVRSHKFAIIPRGTHHS
jgi:hypothetical protein